MLYLGHTYKKLFHTDSTDCFVLYLAILPWKFEPEDKESLPLRKEFDNPLKINMQTRSCGPFLPKSLRCLR